MAPVLARLGVVVALCCRAAGVECQQDGGSYSYTETVGAAERSILINGCPNHPTFYLDFGTAIPQQTEYIVPAHPVFTGDTTATTTASGAVLLTLQTGATGVLFSGAMVHSPFASVSVGAAVDFQTSAAYNEGHVFDPCGCHSSSVSFASYHCHVPPSCLLHQLGQVSDAHSPMVGWSPDGFPMYGPRGPSGLMMQTCTVTGGTYGTDTCTDDCGGFYLDDGSIDEYVYRYYIMGDYNDGKSCDAPSCPSPGSEYFPHTPSCLRGCCPDETTCSFAQITLPACTEFETVFEGYLGSVDPEPATSGCMSMANGLALNTEACRCANISCQEDFSESCGDFASGVCIDGANACPADSSTSPFDMGCMFTTTTSTSTTSTVSTTTVSSTSTFSTTSTMTTTSTTTTSTNTNPPPVGFVLGTVSFTSDIEHQTMLCESAAPSDAIASAAAAVSVSPSALFIVEASVTTCNASTPSRDYEVTWSVGLQSEYEADLLYMAVMARQILFVSTFGRFMELSEGIQLHNLIVSTVSMSPLTSGAYGLAIPCATFVVLARAARLER